MQKQLPKSKAEENSQACWLQPGQQESVDHLSRAMLSTWISSRDLLLSVFLFKTPRWRSQRESGLPSLGQVSTVLSISYSQREGYAIQHRCWGSLPYLWFPCRKVKMVMNWKVKVTPRGISSSGNPLSIASSRSISGKHFFDTLP